MAEQTTTMSPGERQPWDEWSQKSDPAAMRVRGRNPADDESPGMEQDSRATGDSSSVCSLHRKEGHTGGRNPRVCGDGPLASGVSKCGSGLSEPRPHDPDLHSELSSSPPRVGGAEWPMTSAASRAQALGWCAGARSRHDVTETGHGPEHAMLDVQLVRKDRWTRSPERATGAVPARELVEERSK